MFSEYEELKVVVMIIRGANEGVGGGGGVTPPPIFKHSVLHDGYYKVVPKPNPEPVLCAVQRARWEAMVISPICMEHYGNSIVRQNISK